MNKPFIIAEAGSCHEGSLDHALDLIGIAHSAGADAVKFQYWSSHARMRQRRGIEWEPGTPAPYEQGSIEEAWLEPLQKECHNRGLLFSATVYLREDIPTLEKYVDYWKVASFEAKDRGLTQAIPKDGKPFFISTGMQTAHDDAYLPKRAIRLHCVSAYPCPPHEAGLGAILLGQGYSDHTRCVFTGAFAVAAGADYLEVHYRRAETAASCPDYVVALDPETLTKYIALARAAYNMRGSGRKEIQMAERGNLRYQVRG